MPDDQPLWLQNWLNFLEEAGEVGERLTEDLEEAINAIETVEELDCGTNWSVYIRTALPAAAETLWLLLIPQWDEILENYLNPKQTRGGSRRGRRARNRWRAGVRGSPRLFFPRGIPDTNDALARILPGFDAIQGRRISPREWMFWSGVDALDRVLWYWLLLEAGRTFATRWQSEILESEACTGHLEAQGHYFWTDPDESLPAPLGGTIHQENITAMNNIGPFRKCGFTAPSGHVLNGRYTFSWDVSQAWRAIDGTTEYLFTITIMADYWDRPAEPVAVEEHTLLIPPMGVGQFSANMSIFLTDIRGCYAIYEIQLIQGGSAVHPREFSGQGRFVGSMEVDN